MSMQHFLKAWAATGRSEKGYVNNPNDSGGPTNHGITEAVARAHGYTGDMRDLPKDRATQIAKAQYWDVLRLDSVCVYSSTVAYELFDTGFLCGVGNAGTFLQRSLNCFNRSHRPEPDYPEVGEDGVLGPLTIHSLGLYMAKRGRDGEAVMLRSLNSQQGSYLMDLARRREKDEEFTFGWFLNRVVI